MMSEGLLEEVKRCERTFTSGSQALVGGKWAQVIIFSEHEKSERYRTNQKDGADAPSFSMVNKTSRNI